MFSSVVYVYQYSVHSFFLHNLATYYYYYRVYHQLPHCKNFSIVQRIHYRYMCS